MAIVFISPKERQKMFFTGITVLVLLIMLIFSLVVLLARPNPVPQELVFNRPKTDINLQVLDSDQIKNLEPPIQQDLQFKYTATTDKGVKTSGVVTAVSEQEAREMLAGLEMTDIILEEAKIGRDNPFIPYYNISSNPEANTKK